MKKLPLAWTLVAQESEMDFCSSTRIGKRSYGGLGSLGQPAPSTRMAMDAGCTSRKCDPVRRPKRLRREHNDGSSVNPCVPRDNINVHYIIIVDAIVGKIDAAACTFLVFYRSLPSISNASKSDSPIFHSK
jgi:hypothetical protein